MKHVLFQMMICIWVLPACISYTAPTIEELRENPQIKPEEFTVFPELNEATDRLVCVTIDYENLIRDMDNWDQAVQTLLDNSQMIIMGEVQVRTFVDLPYPIIGLNSGPPMSICYEPNMSDGEYVAYFYIKGTNRRELRYSWIFHIDSDTVTSEGQ